MVNKRNEINSVPVHAYDEKTIYCRMLGHHLSFSYCRRPGNRLFCSRIVACWGEQLDITAYLEEHFSREEIQEAMSLPKPKMASLVDLIQQAQKRTES